jgi:alkylation response protein AidB-like acyl-CoA dehydrogenase
VREKVRPRAAAIDQQASFPWDIVEVFRDAGLLGLGLPPEYGGGGADMVTFCLAIDEIARACATSSLIVAAQHLGAMPIMLAGTPEQQARWLPALAQGSRLAAFALTEPEAGSDVGHLRLRARREPTSYRLKGTKTFITHGNIAQTIVTFVATDPAREHRGLSALVVEAPTPGLSAQRIEGKMGIRGSDTATLTFEDVEVPVSHRLGEEGNGFAIAMSTLDRTRLGIAAQALGIAQGAFEAAYAYARERRQFGRPLIEQQAVQFMLADMHTRIEAGRHLLYHAATLADRAGLTLPQPASVARYSAMAKCFCSDTAMQVTTDAVQLFGGYGYIQGNPVERMMRDAKITQIYEGTNQIQRLVIFRHLEAGGPLS